METKSHVDHDCPSHAKAPADAHSHVHDHVQGDEHGHEHPAPVASTADLKDPVCGMTVDTAKALSSVHAGQTYYFCSTTCRDRFVASPEKFTGNGEKPEANMGKSHSSHQH